MKKLFLCLLCLAVLSGFVASNVGGESEAYGFSAAPTPEKDKDPKPFLSFCPKTKIYGKLNDCLKCHVAPTMELKDTHPFGYLTLPPNSEIVFPEGKPVLRYYLDGINDDQVRQFFDWLTWHPEFKHIWIEVDSWGGSVFRSKAILAYMDAFKSHGGIIDTFVNAKAASAGLIIFLNGTKGRRFTTEYSHLMWHELWQFKFWSVDTPSSLEDEAKVLREFMDVQNEWIAARCKLTKKELDALVYKKELWCNGKEAVEKYGFADKLIK